MRTYTQKPQTTPQSVPATPRTPGRAHFGQSREAASDATAPGRFGHDFSRIPVQASAVAKIQTKLVVDTPGDVHEQEADHVSEQVMRMPEPRYQSDGGRRYPTCQAERLAQEPEGVEPDLVRTMHGGAGDWGLVTAPASVQEALASPGQPLDAATRAFMEPRLGHDFSRVRVHTDARAAESAGAVGAAAYTVGPHIVVGRGQPSPQTVAGRRLFAHELAHVVQQSRGGRTPELDPTAPHERDAHAVATAVASGSSGVFVTSQTGVGIARNVVDVSTDLLIELERVGPTELLRRQGPSRIPEIEQRLRSVVEAGGTDAVKAQGLLDEINQVMDAPARQRQLISKIGEAKQLLRPSGKVRYGVGGSRWPYQPTAGQIGRELREVEARGGAAGQRARELREQIQRLRGRIRELERARTAGGAGAPRGGPPGGSSPPSTAATKVETPAATDIPKESSFSARTTPATEAPAATSAAKVESTAAHAAATEAKVATRSSRVGSVAAKVGSKVGSAAAKVGSAAANVGSKLASVGFKGAMCFLPSPLDALALMAQFFGSFEEAREAIRNRETRIGFGKGLAGSLLGRSERAIRKHFAQRVVTETLETKILWAAGVAEKAHNTGLNSGFAYGESLSDDAKDVLRKNGFFMMRVQRTLPGEYQQMLTADGVLRFGIALLPTVDAIFEAMQREAERAQEAEMRRRRASECRGRRC